MSGRYEQAPYSDGAADYNPAGAYNPGPAYDQPHGGDYPMSNKNPYATNSSEPYSKQPKKSRKGLWITVGIIALLCIVGAVVGGVLGSRAANNNKDNDKSEGNSGKTGGGNSNDKSGAPVDNTAFPTGTKGADSGNTAVPTLLNYIADPNMAAQTQTGANGEVYLAVATDTYMLPAYATGTATDGLGAPATQASAVAAWPADPSPPSSSSLRAHPRLIGAGYQWDALKNGLIAQDPYLSFWNATIIANATRTLNDPVVPYSIDGGLSGSGVLDVAREMKMKIKDWAYAYRITGDTTYSDRVFKELENGGTFGANDNTRWNAEGHFLDTAEFCSAYAIAYDWCYDAFTEDQRTQIRGWITDLGLYWGDQAVNASPAPGWAWFTGRSQLIDGNWNCVSMGGLIMASLAIMDEDTTGLAAKILPTAITLAKSNCFEGAYDDGTWAETANYWYFGTTGAAEIVSALTTAQGDDQGLATANPGYNLTSLYHMYVQGMTSLFNYGDHGPNKFSSTANSLLLWGKTFNEPRYTLYQRDHYDSSEPFSMFWYDPTVEGAWWNGLPLDRHFDDPRGEWATARSSWSDNSGSYWAIKAGNLTGHQTHGNLDLGDFVYDAMGQRWAGDLGSGQYLSPGYFSSEAPDSARWQYYRAATQGQNTILINNANQNPAAASVPTVQFGSSGTAQGAAPYMEIGKDDSAFATLDMSAAYGTPTVKRGIRFINGRRQLLVQDEVSNVPSNQDIMWRVHTNGTINEGGIGTDEVTLSLGGQTLKVKILNSTPAGLTFGSMEPTPIAGSLTLPSGATAADNLPNTGTTVLTIDNPAGGSMSVEVLWTPQWPGLSDSDYVTPPSVALDQWTVTSHN